MSDMLCLDTNVAVMVMNKTSRGLLDRFKDEAAEEPLFLPSIALFELRFGIAHSDRPVENAQKLKAFLALPVSIWSFDALDAEEAGDIRANLRKKGTPIGPYDILIAAQARRRDATLVTANTREFSRVPGLRLDDWS